MIAGPSAILLWRGASSFWALGQKFARKALDAARRERPRWPLWLPFALAAGAGGYFALPVEPSLGLGLLSSALALLAAMLSGFSQKLRRKIVLALAAAVLLGGTLAKARTEWVRAPILTERAGPLHLTARVVASEPKGDGSRLLLKLLPVARLGEKTPDYVRLTVRAASAVPPPGAMVELLAVLMPPPEPSMPGDYDFGRWAYFHRIGAVGYVYGRPHILADTAPAGLMTRLSLALEALRGAMTARVRSVIPGPDGVISAALITGQRVDIDPADQTAFRDSGLMHVLSISGLHLALAGGLFFWTIRALFALFPAIVLRHAIKKWAAVAALLGSAFYLLISGCEAPAVRSFVMLAVMFLAILVDRPALSMRSVAWAAALIVAATPEAVLDPGCQMSFAAVTGLIAFAEWSTQHREEAAPKGWLRRAWLYFGGICITSIIAGLATAPISIFHFDRASPYGILANLAALPIVSVIIMPGAVASMVTMPFGLDHWPLAVMGKGVSAMMAIAHWVAALPGAGKMVPAWPGLAVAAVMFGGLWVALWRTGWRWLGVLPIAFGIWAALSAEPPDLLIARDGRTVALRLGDGRLAFASKPADRYAAENWLRRAGDARLPGEAIGGAGLRCDALGCIARSHGRRIAISKRAEALAEDCISADIVVSAVPAHGICVGPKLVIDRDDLAANGAYALRLGEPLKVETVADLRGNRPWSGVLPQPCP